MAPFPLNEEPTRKPKPASFDHLVGGKLRRDRKSEGGRGPAIDHELKLRRLLDRQLAWLRAFQNLVHEGSGAAVEILETFAIAHQSPGLGIFALRRDRWQTRLERKRGEPLLLLEEKSVIRDHDCLDAFARQGGKRGLD